MITHSIWSCCCIPWQTHASPKPSICRDGESMLGQKLCWKDFMWFPGPYLAIFSILFANLKLMMNWSPLVVICVPYKMIVLWNNWLYSFWKKCRGIGCKICWKTYLGSNVSKRIIPPPVATAPWRQGYIFKNYKMSCLIINKTSPSIFFKSSTVIGRKEPSFNKGRKLQAN